MPPPLRLVFFGTPEFAVPTLDALVAAGRRPLGVVTRPARPVGRGRELAEPPVAVAAARHGLVVLQPEKVRTVDFLNEMRSLQPDVFVVVAFGQIFPQSLLDIPRLGSINVHASLLPRWRGASPIQAALAAGDTETGVTTMKMAVGLDSGPVLERAELAIEANETAAELGARLAELGARLLVQTLDGLAADTLSATPQPDEGVTFAPMIKKTDGRVDWRLPARELAARGRAFTPWPGLEASLLGNPVKLAGARAVAGESTTEAPGTVLGVFEGALRVACGGGTVLALATLQRPGKRALGATDFVNGERLARGARFELEEDSP